MKHDHRDDAGKYHPQGGLEDGANAGKIALDPRAWEGRLPAEARALLHPTYKHSREPLRTPLKTSSDGPYMADGGMNRAPHSSFGKGEK